MKIEMGESLFYSWLRHVKECQIVQTNWKVSSQWQLSEEDALIGLMESIHQHYFRKYGYSIFKQNRNLSQLLQQGECDVLGISIQADSTSYYAVDVAFHEGGLNYGDRATTVMKVLEKCARTAFCLIGYLGTKEADIIFASPRITPGLLSDLGPCIEEMNTLFSENGYRFSFRIIANQEYNDLVLQPILLVSDGVADTSELFLRSYQMYKMFSDSASAVRKSPFVCRQAQNAMPNNTCLTKDGYSELKIGQLAKNVLGKMLMEGCATDAEVAAMQTPEYSKQTFDLQYPLLREALESKRPPHYYSSPILVNGRYYRMCNEWFEIEGGNNDRPHLLIWIETHKKNDT